mmetsp:Transcript_8078/g.17461  ORF Transcript_8078/g.17461 Transcript_8078/m.17461 type:complete len:554 (-) Transcript_8078:133-1794(-)
MALQQRQKQSVGQRLAVVQKVLEYGVASVLEKRRAFPPDFFVHGTLDGTSLSYARFDEEWLNNAGGSPGSSAGSRGDGDTSSDGDGDGDSNVRGDDDVTTIPDKLTSRKRARIGSSRSRTTSSILDIHPPPANALLVDRDHRRSDGRFTCTSDDIHDNAGAPPLLVGGSQASISQLLPPLSVLPSASTSSVTTCTSHESTARPLTTLPRAVVEEDVGSIDRMRSEALILLRWIRDGAATVLQHDMHSRVVVGICCPGATRNDKDRLVESFAFDITQDVNLLRARSFGMDRSAVQREVEGILRNIHGYSSSNFGGGGAAAVACALPKDRFFTFRVEFSQPVPQNLLPPSLDANSPHFGKLEHFGRVLAADDAIPRAHWEPSADRSTLQRLDAFQLGRVDGKVFGLQMVAFTGEDERVRSDRPGLRCVKAKSPDQSAPADSLLVLPETGTGVMAFPHGMLNAMAGTIIDIRVTKNQRQFKVRFHGPIQEPKQWICSSMVVSSTIPNSNIQKAGGEARLSGATFGSSAATQRDTKGRRCHKRARFSYLCEPIRVIL